MYEIDKEGKYIDYDLQSAYITGISELPRPYYYNSYLVKTEDLINWSDNQLMTGYLIVNCDFKFPSNVKYPSIPLLCR